MDFVVQKAVELGVKKIVPFFSKNVVVKLDDKSRIKRQEKLQIIANEACKQCGRTDTVNISDFIEFNDLIKNIDKHEVNFFAYEAETNSLRDNIDECKKNSHNDISLIIGAEGGFDSKEAENLKQMNKVRCVSLGSRILRAETASLNLLSIIMYELDI
jgi:16S rRNA (uracil1498-N3)-methyltransferase